MIGQQLHGAGNGDVHVTFFLRLPVAVELVFARQLPDVDVFALDAGEPVHLFQPGIGRQRRRGMLGQRKLRLATNRQAIGIRAEEGVNAGEDSRRKEDEKDRCNHDPAGEDIPPLVSNRVVLETLAASRGCSSSGEPEGWPNSFEGSPASGSGFSAISNRLLRFARSESVLAFDVFLVQMAKVEGRFTIRIVGRQDRAATEPIEEIPHPDPAHRIGVRNSIQCWVRLGA